MIGDGCAQSSEVGVLKGMRGAGSCSVQQPLDEGREKGGRRGSLGSGRGGMGLVRAGTYGNGRSDKSKPGPVSP